MIGRPPKRTSGSMPTPNRSRIWAISSASRRSALAWPVASAQTRRIGSQSVTALAWSPSTDSTRSTSGRAASAAEGADQQGVREHGGGADRRRRGVVGVAGPPADVGRELRLDLLGDLGEDLGRTRRQEDVGGVGDRELERGRQARVRGRVVEGEAAAPRPDLEALGEALLEPDRPEPGELFGRTLRRVTVRDLGVEPRPGERPGGVDGLRGEGAAPELDLELVGGRLPR